MIRCCQAECKHVFSITWLGLHVAPRSSADACHRNHFAATGARSGHALTGCWVDKSTPETLTTAYHAASWLARL